MGGVATRLPDVRPLGLLPGVGRVRPVEVTAGVVADVSRAVDGLLHVRRGLPPAGRARDAPRLPTEAQITLPRTADLAVVHGAPPRPCDAMAPCIPVPVAPDHVAVAVASSGVLLLV